MARYSGFGFDLASCVFLRIYVGVYVQADGVLIALASAFNTKYEGKWVGIGEQGLGYKAWKGRGKDRCALAYIHVRFRLRRAYRQTCFKYRSRAARIKCVKICNVLFVSLVCGFQCSSNVLVCSNAMFLNSNHYMKSKLLDEFNSSPCISQCGLGGYFKVLETYQHQALRAYFDLYLWNFRWLLCILS